MRRIALLVLIAFYGCSSAPALPEEVTVVVSWPSAPPSSMTVVAYGPALRELGRKTVTGADTVRLRCPSRAFAALAFPYTEGEWRSLRLSRLSALPSAAVSYGSGYGPSTRFCSGFSPVDAGECRISAREMLFRRDIRLKVNDPSLIASIAGSLSGVPAGSLLSGGVLPEKASVPLQDWSFSGQEALASCCLFDRDCIAEVSVRILLRDGRTVCRTSFQSGPPGHFPVPEVKLPLASSGGFFEAEVEDWTQSDTIIINV